MSCASEPHRFAPFDSDRDSLVVTEEVIHSDSQSKPIDCCPSAFRLRPSYERPSMETLADPPDQLFDNSNLSGLDIGPAILKTRAMTSCSLQQQYTTMTYSSSHLNTVLQISDFSDCEALHDTLPCYRGQMTNDHRGDVIQNSSLNISKLFRSSVVYPTCGDKGMSTSDVMNSKNDGISKDGDIATSAEHSQLSSAIVKDIQVLRVDSVASNNDAVSQRTAAVSELFVKSHDDVTITVSGTDVTGQETNVIIQSGDSASGAISRPSSSTSHFSEFDSGFDEMRGRSVTPSALVPDVFGLEGASGVNTKEQYKREGWATGEDPQGVTDVKQDHGQDTSFTAVITTTANCEQQGDAERPFKSSGTLATERRQARIDLGCNSVDGLLSSSFSSSIVYDESDAELDYSRSEEETDGESFDASEREIIARALGNRSFDEDEVDDNHIGRGWYASNNPSKDDEPKGLDSDNASWDQDGAHSGNSYEDKEHSELNFDIASSSEGHGDDSKNNSSSDKERSESISDNADGETHRLLDINNIAVNACEEKIFLKRVVQNDAQSFGGSAVPTDIFTRPRDVVTIERLNTRSLGRDESTDVDSMDEGGRRASLRINDLSFDVSRDISHDVSCNYQCDGILATSHTASRDISHATLATSHAASRDIIHSFVTYQSDCEKNNRDVSFGFRTGCTRNDNRPVIKYGISASVHYTNENDSTRAADDTDVIRYIPQISRDVIDTCDPNVVYNDVTCHDIAFSRRFWQPWNDVSADMKSTEPKLVSRDNDLHDSARSITSKFHGTEPRVEGGELFDRSTALCLADSIENGPRLSLPYGYVEKPWINRFLSDNGNSAASGSLLGHPTRQNTVPITPCRASFDKNDANVPYEMNSTPQLLQTGSFPPPPTRLDAPVMKVNSGKDSDDYYLQSMSQMTGEKRDTPYVQRVQNWQGELLTQPSNNRHSSQQVSKPDQENWQPPNTPADLCYSGNNMTRATPDMNHRSVLSEVNLVQENQFFSSATRTLNPLAIYLMSDWYDRNIHHPYPSASEKIRLANSGGISVAQVTSWFGNRRWRHRRRNITAEGPNATFREHDDEEASMSKRLRLGDHN